MGVSSSKSSSSTTPKSTVLTVDREHSTLAQGEGSVLVSKLHELWQIADLASFVLSFTAVDDLLRLTSVSRHVHTLADNDVVWKAMSARAQHVIHTAMITNSPLPLPIAAATPSADTANEETAMPVPLLSRKHQYIVRYLCSFAGSRQCRRLVRPVDTVEYSGAALTPLDNQGPPPDNIYVAPAVPNVDESAMMPLPPYVYNDLADSDTNERSAVLPVCSACRSFLARICKTYYENESELGTVYSMTPPQYVARTSPKTIHLRYVHSGIYTDYDYRRLIIQLVNGTWNVRQLEDHRSSNRCLTTPNNIAHDQQLMQKNPRLTNVRRLPVRFGRIRPVRLNNNNNNNNR